MKTNTYIQEEKKTAKCVLGALCVIVVWVFTSKGSVVVLSWAYNEEKYIEREREKKLLQHNMTDEYMIMRMV